MTRFGGLDVGTSGSRILVTDSSLSTLFEASREYPSRSPREGWAEQHPQVIHRACTELIGEALRRFRQIYEELDRDYRLLQ
jgi:gluconokinase